MDRALAVHEGEMEKKRWGVQRLWIASRSSKFNALVDIPYNNHYWQLMNEYKSAKVILTVHPGGPDHWVTSAIKDGLDQHLHQFSPVPGCNVHGDDVHTRVACAE